MAQKQKLFFDPHFAPPVSPTPDCAECGRVGNWDPRWVENYTPGTGKCGWWQGTNVEGEPIGMHSLCLLRSGLPDGVETMCFTWGSHDPTPNPSLDCRGMSAEVQRDCVVPDCMCRQYPHVITRANFDQVTCTLTLPDGTTCRAFIKAPRLPADV